jgi:uncharacterized protein YbcI
LDPATTEQPGTAGERDGLLLSEVSNAMVRLYKERFGRGPTRVRTSYAGPDLLVSLLEETLTPTERKLAELGEYERVRDTRSVLARATEGELVEVVEQITGRRVRSYMSAMDPEHDAACEVFVLEPWPGPPGTARKGRPGQDSNLRPAA